MNETFEGRFMARSGTLDQVLYQNGNLVGQGSSKYNEQNYNKKFSFILDTQIYKNRKVERDPYQSSADGMHDGVKKRRME